MAFVPNDEWGKAVICWEIGLFEVCVVINFRHDATVTAADFQNLADRVATWASATYRTYISQDCVFTGVDVYDMSSDSAPVYTSLIGAGMAGAVAIDVAGLQVAIIGTLKTGNRGRSYRGRNYWPGWSENSLTDGLWEAGSIANMASIIAQLETQVGLDDWELVVASTVENGSPRTTAVLTPVTSVTTHIISGTQRRRT